MLSNCDAGKDSWESLGLQGDQTSGNQPWIFIGRTDAKAEAPILWLVDAKNHPIGKYPDAGKDLKSKREGGGKGWDDWMASLTNGHEFGQTLGDSEGQRILACCIPWGRRVGHSLTRNINTTSCLQCYVSFCYTTKWINYKYMYIQPVLDHPAFKFHPSKTSQSTKLSCLCCTIGSY